MLTPPVVMATYYYGERALRLVLLSALTAVIAEYIGSIFVRRKATLIDLNALCIGVMIPLLLPASSPVWLPMVGVVFAVVAVKLPFGNARSVLFDPVCGAIAFLTVCSKAYVFRYPVVGKITLANIVSGEEFVEGTSIGSLLFNNNSIGTNFANMLNIWIGNTVGPMGATCTFVFVALIVSMLFRRIKELPAVVSFLGVAALFAALFPRVLTGRLVSVVMELSSGMLLFAAVFLLTNPTILPKTLRGKVCFGAFAAAVCMLMRYFGQFEEGVCFAILLADALSEQFDRIHLPQFNFGKKNKTDNAVLSTEELDRITDASFVDIGEVPQSGGASNG